MLRPALRFMGFAFFLSLVLPVAHALPGDAAAVLAHCGPTSNDQVLRPSNGPPERTLTYNGVALRFQPADGDWSFVAASDSGLPLTQVAAVQRLPCLGDALEEVAARPPVQATTEGQTSTEATSHAKVDRTNDMFLWIVGLVVAGILFFAIRPYMKSEPKRNPVPETPRSPRRRPSATGIQARPRKPADPPSSGSRRATAVSAQANDLEMEEPIESPEETDGPLP